MEPSNRVTATFELNQKYGEQDRPRIETEIRNHLKQNQGNNIIKDLVGVSFDEPAKTGKSSDK